MRQFLLIDADDTLWESSVYFEEAIEEFIDFLDHSSLTDAQIRQALDEIELESIAQHGYGSKSFARNLRRCFEHLAERRYSEADLDRVTAMGEAILDRPMEILEGVADTLEYLTARHHLTLFTKGHSEEQLMKFQRSRLGPYFHGCRVVHEKTVEAYREIVAQEKMAPERTWMIGNSPKSDIHPALDAGLGAVLAPHERTWSLEVVDLPNGHPRFRTVERFTELRGLF